MVGEFIARVLVYGCIGLLLEFFFTGIHSVVVLRSRNAICRSSLWMVPIYGLGAEGMGFLRIFLTEPYLFIPAAVLFIFAVEYASGRILRLAGVTVWDYSHSRFSLHGLVRADYLPFWLMVAIGYDVLADYITKIMEFVGKIA